MTLYTLKQQEMCQPVGICVYGLYRIHASCLVSRTAFHYNMLEQQGNMGKGENTEWDVMKTGSDSEFSSGKQNGRTNPIDLL